LEKDDGTFYNRLYRNNRDGTTRLMSWSRTRKLIHRWRIQLKSGVVALAVSSGRETKTTQNWLELYDRKHLRNFVGASNGLDRSLIIPPLWRSLGGTYGRSEHQKPPRLSLQTASAPIGRSRHLMLSRLWRHWQSAAQLFLRMIAPFRRYPVSASCNCLPTLTLDDPARAQHPFHPAMFSLHSLSSSGTNAIAIRAETSHLQFHL
jgi:hypothetical protein